MELIYILTYDCNFRCSYCDIDKRNDNISNKVIEKSFDFIKKNYIDYNKVKFFGGEPLLKEFTIKKIIKEIPIFKKTDFYVTTNSTLINQEFMNFAKNNNLQVTFSIDGDSETNGENRLLINGNNLSNIIIKNTKYFSDKIRVNQVITSKNSKNFFNNFKFIYDLGVRKFNFLPEYYREWSKEGLFFLKEGFDEIFNFYESGNHFSIINLENYSETAFFNLGIVIDTDGSIYGTNLILSGIFEKYKKELYIGSVFENDFVNIYDSNFQKKYINKISKIIELEYNINILKSVKYIDLILNNFCNKFN